MSAPAPHCYEQPPTPFCHKKVTQVGENLDTSLVFVISERGGRVTATMRMKVSGQHPHRRHQSVHRASLQNSAKVFCKPTKSLVPLKHVDECSILDVIILVDVHQLSPGNHLNQMKTCYHASQQQSPHVDFAQRWENTGAVSD